MIRATCGWCCDWLDIYGEARADGFCSAECAEKKAREGMYPVCVECGAPCEGQDRPSPRCHDCSRDRAVESGCAR